MAVKAVNISGLKSALGQLAQSNSLMAQRREAEEERKRQKQREKGELFATVAGIGGTLAGGAYGGPLGAAIGGSAGSLLGRSLGGGTTSPTQGAQALGNVAVAYQNQPAIERRQELNRRLDEQYKASQNIAENIRKQELSKVPPVYSPTGEIANTPEQQQRIDLINATRGLSATETKSILSTPKPRGEDVVENVGGRSFIKTPDGQLKELRALPKPDKVKPDKELSPEQKADLYRQSVSALAGGEQVQGPIPNLKNVSPSQIPELARVSEVNRRLPTLNERYKKAIEPNAFEGDLSKQLAELDDLSGEATTLGTKGLKEKIDKKSKRLLAQMKKSSEKGKPTFGEGLEGSAIETVLEMHKEARSGKEFTPEDLEKYRVARTLTEQEKTFTDPQGNTFIRKTSPFVNIPDQFKGVTKDVSLEQTGDASQKFISTDYALEHGLRPDTTIEQASEMSLGRKLSATEKSKVTDSKTALDIMEELGRSYDPDFVGPLSGKFSKLSGVTGIGLSQKRADFLTNSKGLLNATVRAITGAQMNRDEVPRVMGQVPQPEDPPKLWLAKKRFTMRNLRSIHQRTIESPNVPVRLGIPKEFTKEWPAFPQNKEEFSSLPKGSYYYHPKTGKFARK